MPVRYTLSLDLKNYRQNMITLIQNFVQAKIFGSVSKQISADTIMTWMKYLLLRIGGHISSNRIFFIKNV